MALRMLEMVLQEKDAAGVRELLNECKVLEHRQIRLAEGEVLVRILLDVEQSETVMDLLEKRYSGGEGNRVVILPVEATLPRAQAEAEPEVAPSSESSQPEEKSPERIGREELYEDIKNGARLSAREKIVEALGEIHEAYSVHGHKLTQEAQEIAHRSGSVPWDQLDVFHVRMQEVAAGLKKIHTDTEAIRAKYPTVHSEVDWLLRSKQFKWSLSSRQSKNLRI